MAKIETGNVSELDAVLGREDMTLTLLSGADNSALHEQSVVEDAEESFGLPHPITRGVVNPLVRFYTSAGRPDEAVAAGERFALPPEGAEAET